MDITLTISRQSLDMLKNAPARMREALIPAMKRCMAAAEATAKRDYLSGPRPTRLDRRTGRLRGSIATEAVMDGNKIVGRIGSNVVYARIHEQGLVGAVNVRAHMRRTKAGAAAVRAHTRRVNMRRRPFLRPALEDNLDKFNDIFADAIITAFGG